MWLTRRPHHAGACRAASTSPPILSSPSHTRRARNVRHRASQLVRPHRVRSRATAGTGPAFRYAADTNSHSRDLPKNMRRTRHGFTFVELLTVMVVMGLLAGIGVPRIRNMKERSYQATLRSDLGTLRTAEEAYYAENLRYTTDVKALDFRPSSDVEIIIVSTDPP